jgi:hypothetical protein
MYKYNPTKSKGAYYYAAMRSNLNKQPLTSILTMYAVLLTELKQTFFCICTLINTLVRNPLIRKYIYVLFVLIARSFQHQCRDHIQTLKRPSKEKKNETKIPYSFVSKITCRINQKHKKEFHIQRKTDG